MAFQKLAQPSFPRRLWGLYGLPGSGKSTFAARMRGPMLAIDADHRFDEVARLAGGAVYRLSETPADNIDPERIAASLRANMPGGDVRTILVDSLTAIIAPLTVQAILDNDAGRNKNKMSGFRDKALALRLLQDVVTGWGVDCLWIWHLQRGFNEKAQEQTTATVSRTELARLTRSLNAMLRVVEENGRRGVHVDWARRGRSGVTVWDASGNWQGAPEAIERAVYDGLSEEDRKRLEAATPASFAGPEQAIAWGMTQAGVFKDEVHAGNAYEALKREHKPSSAAEMWAAWIADVQERKAAATQETAPAEMF
jgi:hypothetical protein